MISREELENYINHGMKVSSIAKRHGVTAQAVYYWIKKYRMDADIYCKTHKKRSVKRIDYPHRDEFEQWLKLKYRGSYSTWMNVTGLVASFYKKGLLYNSKEFENYIIKGFKSKSRTNYRRAFRLYHEFLNEIHGIEALE
jgi:transposase